MDLATLLGLIGALGVVIAAIFHAGQPFIFLDIPAMMIVIAGSMLVVLMKFSLRQFLGAIRVAINAFRPQSIQLEKIIAEIVELAAVARKKGLLEVEKRPIRDPFLKQGLQFVIDGVDGASLRMTLQKEIQQTQERHEIGQKIFKSLGEVAPAMGMIGTLVGLIQMFSSLQDPSLIGPAMAITIVATLYGAILANVIALPIADKLALRSREEKMAKQLTADGVLAIQSGMHPRTIQDLLNAYLPKNHRPPRGD